VSKQQFLKETNDSTGVKTSTKEMGGMLAASHHGAHQPAYQ
jgi:hypothetical protein